MENFGCRTSQADGDAIAAALDDLHALPAGGLQQADVVVVNTCSVTAEADRDARAYIRRVHRANPNARVVVTGCYAQRAPQELAALPGVYAVIGNSHKNQVASIAAGQARPLSTHSSGFVPLRSLQASSASSVTVQLDKKSVIPSEAGPSFSAREVEGPAVTFAVDSNCTPSGSFRPFLLTGDIFAHSDFQLPSLAGAVATRPSDAAHRTRPSLKIQDGCGNRCTFCVIPSTRGNSRSLPREGVLEAVRQFVDSGGKEIVITGINLGRWGRDLTPKMRLEDLLAEILQTTALSRLRISSVEPMDWSDCLIALFARWGTGEHPRLARHIHMPLQSGSDSVLRRMHRRYRPWHYAERVAAARAASPEAAIGADVMVGFPGETDEEFEHTRAFIAAQPFTYLHLFPFSARPGTAGWELHRQTPVPAAAVRRRMMALRALIDQKNLAFRSGFIGKILSAVTLNSSPAPIEENAAPRNSTALTDNFLPVELDCFCAPNLLLQVKITNTTAHGLSGIALNSD